MWGRKSSKWDERVETDVRVFTTVLRVHFKLANVVKDIIFVKI